MYVISTTKKEAFCFFFLFLYCVLEIQGVSYLQHLSVQRSHPLRGQKPHVAPGYTPDSAGLVSGADVFTNASFRPLSRRPHPPLASPCMEGGFRKVCYRLWEPQPPGLHTSREEAMSGMMDSH